MEAYPSNKPLKLNKDISTKCPQEFFQPGCELFEYLNWLSSDL